MTKRPVDPAVVRFQDARAKLDAARITAASAQAALRIAEAEYSLATAALAYSFWPGTKPAGWSGWPYYGSHRYMPTNWS
jgi:hypothetical protein